MNIITLDFETFYDKEFSLSKMTTEEYVRSPLFETIGVSIKVSPNSAARWFPKPLVARALSLIDWSNSAVLCHNTQFDGFILSHHYGIIPKLYIDTLSMARPFHYATVGGSLKALVQHYEIGVKGTEVINALGMHYDDFTPDALARYGEYCCNDGEITWSLYLRLLERMGPTAIRELLIIDRVIRMFCDPKLVLDETLLKQYHAEVLEGKEETLAQVAQIADKDTLMSNDKLALVLESLGVDPPQKKSIKKSATKGYEVMSWAFGKTDKAFTALLEHDNPLVAGLVGARLGVKSTIEETRSARFIGIASRGLLPVALQYCGAATTGRKSGGDKQNLQNLKRGGKLRQAIMAPPGYTLIDIDSSNIELRVNHTLAGQHDTIQMLREGRDLYCEFASMIFGRPITKADKMERFLGKTAQLGLGYGCGWEKFREMCRIQSEGEVILDEAESKRIVYLWRNTYDRLPAMWKRFDDALDFVARGEVAQVDDVGLVSTDFERLVTKPGNQILYTDLHRNTKNEWIYHVRNETKYLYGAKVDENVCQHLANNIIDDQLLVISGRYPVVLAIHDSVVYLAPDDEAEEALNFGIETMSTSPCWWPDIPLAAEGKMGKVLS